MRTYGQNMHAIFMRISVACSRELSSNDDKTWNITARDMVTQSLLNPLAEASSSCVSSSAANGHSCATSPHFSSKNLHATSYLQRAIKIDACVTVESAEATHRNKIRGVHQYADGLQSQHVEIGGGARVVRHGLQGLVFQRVHVLRCKVLGRECNAACAATHAPSTLHAAGRSSTAPRIFARSL